MSKLPAFVFGTSLALSGCGDLSKNSEKASVSDFSPWLSIFFQKACTEILTSGNPTSPEISVTCQKKEDFKKRSDHISHPINGSPRLSVLESNIFDKQIEIGKLEILIKNPDIDSAKRNYLWEWIEMKTQMLTQYQENLYSAIEEDREKMEKSHDPSRVALFYSRVLSKIKDLRFS